MNPAKHVIKTCGGVLAVSGWLKISEVSVRRWTWPKERGGTGGVIPAKRQRALLEAARQNGINLTPADFFIAHQDLAA